jgi:hypothetical protein
MSGSTSEDFIIEEQGHAAFADDTTPVCLEFHNINYGIKVRKQGAS